MPSRLCTLTLTPKEELAKKTTTYRHFYFLGPQEERLSEGFPSISERSPEGGILKGNPIVHL